MCLGEWTNGQAALHEGYGRHVLNRRRIMEAHHVEPFHAGSRRDADNILILCHAHRQQILGDKLALGLISKALERGESKTLRFQDSRADLTTEVEGVLVEVPVPVDNTSIPIFFTKEHAERWGERSALSSEREP